MPSMARLGNQIVSQCETTRWDNVFPLCFVQAVYPLSLRLRSLR